MTIPAAMFIESAVDMLPNVPENSRVAQRKELHVAVGDKSEDFQAGYELGIQACRVLLSLMPAAIQSGVTL